METEHQSALTYFHSSRNGSSYSTPDELPPETPPDSLTCHRHSPGTIIPNRIFVGGIDYKVNESDLRQIFSRYGAVKEVKIVMDRLGMTKGYGFVTFETQEDVLKILSIANGISLNEKKLCIGQAFRKHQTSGQSQNACMATLDPGMPHQMACGTFFLTTSTGYPYTYHNGMAYFHCANMNPLPQHWSPAPQLMFPQSHQAVHHQQLMYHHCQSVPNQNQWNAVQVPMSPGAAMYSQQSEYLYHPYDGGSFLASAPVIEDVTPKFVEPVVPPFYSGRVPFVPQNDPTKNQMFPPSRVPLKSKYRRYTHPKSIYRLPKEPETQEASTFHSSQPLV